MDDLTLLSIIEKWLANNGYNYMATKEDISVTPLITFAKLDSTGISIAGRISRVARQVFSVYYDHIILDEQNAAQEPTPIYIHDPEFFDKLALLLKSMGARTQAWRRTT